MNKRPVEGVNGSATKMPSRPSGKVWHRNEQGDLMGNRNAAP